MEEEKVKIKVSITTYNTIERVRKKLSKNPHFEWVRYLDTGEFLEVFFGLSEVSQFCRETFNSILKNIPPERIVVQRRKKLEKGTEKQKTRVEYVTSLQKKVLDALEKANMPLTVKQIDRILEEKVDVNGCIMKLKERGLVSHVPKSHLWQLNSKVKYEVRVMIKQRLLSLLKATKEPMATIKIADKVGASRRLISRYLWDFHKRGIVERIPKNHNLTLWKIKD